MATQAEIQISYDVGNDFFKLWLDESMNYSCAVWSEGDDLEQAQRRKLDFLHSTARVESTSRVLDIGCGWGANLERLVNHAAVASAHGITMSPAQAAGIRSRGLERCEVTLTDYHDFRPAELFDAVVSIEMFEHIATPEQERRGEHMAVFRDYFRSAHRWTRPGAWFALHTITVNRLPRREDHIRDIAVATRQILPGSRCARLHEVLQACGTWWEVVEITTRREDYVRTCLEWLRRLTSHEALIRERWGDGVYAEYKHYLEACVMAFDFHYLSVAQLGLRRIDR